jgi:hypothetical protein
LARRLPDRPANKIADLLRGIGKPRGSLWPPDRLRSPRSGPLAGTGRMDILVAPTLALRQSRGASSRYPAVAQRCGSEQPCVRPVNAVHVTAGHNAFRGSGPGQEHAFDNALARVGCPDRRIDRLGTTWCCPSNRHITPDARTASSGSQPERTNPQGVKQQSRALLTKRGMQTKHSQVLPQRLASRRAR